MSVCDLKSLALRSHDQFEASHWSTLETLETKEAVLISASVERFDVSRIQELKKPKIKTVETIYNKLLPCVCMSCFFLLLNLKKV